MVLTIVDLCLSVQSFAEFHTINDNSIFNNNNHNDNNSNKLSSREHFWINQSDDDITGDKSDESKVFQQKTDRSSQMAYKSYGGYQSMAGDNDRKNFILSNYLSDGEIERRIQFNGITAKETLVSNNGYAPRTLFFLYSLLACFVLIFYVRSYFNMTLVINLQIVRCCIDRF